LDLFWTDLLLKLAKTGAMSFEELKKLDVYEFFLVLLNTEKQNKAE